jgi:hypothetical protein
MDDAQNQVLERLNPIFKQLGKREPSTAIEADAVLENIRRGKGYMSDGFVTAIKVLPDDYREWIEEIFEKTRRTEAKYTKA